MKWNELNSAHFCTGSFSARAAARRTSSALSRPRHQELVTLRSVRSTAVSTIVEKPIRVQRYNIRRQPMPFSWPKISSTTLR